MTTPGRNGTTTEHEGWRLDALTPEQARKGSRILTRLNDWLVDTGVGFVMADDVRQVLGGLMVECNRIVREAPKEPTS